ncbi:MAG: hypothetical protein UHD09_09660, partial [Bifidobacterium sp.]|nr:hypothetical protein [Bifidobacterium sp.]
MSTGCSTGRAASRAAEALARERAGGAGHRAHGAGGARLDRRELRAGVAAHLVDLLLAALLGQHHLRAQLAAGDLQPGEAVALRVVRHLENARAERVRVRGLARERGEAVEERVDAVEPERAAEVHGDDGARGDEVLDSGGGERAGGQVLVHRGLGLHGDLLER